jgi:hypothetical protein
MREHGVYTDTHHRNFLVDNFLKINPRLFYIGVAVVTLIYLMSIISEWVDPYLPVFVKDIVSVIGFLITLGLVKTGVFTAKRGAAAIVYILAVGQNSTLIHAMLFGSDSYQSLLLFATMTDFFVIFIAGFFLSVRSTLIASVILSAILSMAGFLSPQEHLRYLGVMLPLVLTPFILFFYYYRTTIEQLIEKIISARRRLGVKHAELKKTQAYLVTQEKIICIRPACNRDGP